MGRILCIDYGERHTGIAVSDPTRTIAQALPTIHHATEGELLEALQRLIEPGKPESTSGRPGGPQPGA